MRTWILSGGLRLGALALLLGAFIAGCGGGGTGTASNREQPLAATSPAAVFPRVISINRVSQTNLSDGRVESIYRVNIVNGPEAKSGLMATIVEAPGSLEVVDGSVLVGNVTANGTSAPTDTITIRHARSAPATSANLVWAVSEPINGIPVPPEPNSLTNQSTVKGVDSNANGVRDDIERLVAQAFGAVPTDYDAAFDVAKTLQDVLLNRNDLTTSAHLNLIACMPSVLRKRMPAVEHLTLNTEQRRGLYVRAFVGLELTEEGCAK